MLWLDAGNKVQDPAALEVIFANASARGVWTDTSFGSLRRWVHPAMVARFRAEALLDAHGDDSMMCNGALVAFSRTHAAYDAVLVPWADCAMDLACIAPPGADRFNHRQDQSSLSLLAYAHGLGDLCNGTSGLVGKHAQITAHFYDREFDRKPRGVKAKYLNKVAEDPYCTQCKCC